MRKSPAFRRPANVRLGSEADIQAGYPKRPLSGVKQTSEGLLLVLAAPFAPAMGAWMIGTSMPTRSSNSRLGHMRSHPLCRIRGHYVPTLGSTKDTATSAANHRGRGCGNHLLFAGPLMSEVGHNRSWRTSSRMSAVAGRPDVARRWSELLLLAKRRHWRYPRRWRTGR